MLNRILAFFIICVASLVPKFLTNPTEDELE